MPKYQPDGRLSLKVIYEKIAAVFTTGYERFEWMNQKLDGTPVPTEITVVRVHKENSSSAVVYARDIREIKRHEAIQERSRQRVKDLLELAQMTQQTELEIIDYTIKSIISLTDSMMGYVVLLEYAKDVLPFRSLVLDQSFYCELPTMTDRGQPHVLSPALTECLTANKAVIHDDFQSLPGNRVFPEGHFPVHTHMNFPIMDGGVTVGILGVGNKQTPYDDADVRHLSLLAQGLGNLLNRKKYAESLENAKNEAERANRAKSEFLAHMSHEIRTPLNGVIGLSELLSGTPLNEKQSEYVQFINVSGNALLFLINDILDFSFFFSGKLNIDTEPFDLAATIQTVLASLVSRASGKNLELAVSICQYLPKIVYGDSGRIRQILLNLIGNAVKFTEKGGVRVDVTIESISETTITVRFCVIDSGIGIPESAIERLFNAFTQVDASSARVYGGTGLGLAISMQLVRLMKGEIGVESAVGKGSTFWFTIPFECDPKVIQCYGIEECPDRSCSNIDGRFCVAFVNREIEAEYSLEGRNVLIVDDNTVQCDALRIQLENWKMLCVTSRSCAEALHLSEQYRQQGKSFELSIINSVFSDGTGAELAQKLFEQEQQQDGTQHSQVVLLRSLSEDFEHDALDEERIEWISKPFFSSALFNAVMNRVFVSEIQKGLSSGVFSPVDANGQKLARVLIPPKPRPDAQIANTPDRLKSHLAGKIHVLIVEDNRVNQIVAQNLMAEAGFSSEIACDGVEACSAVRNKKYDVVLMDCQMPEMDGFEATRLIRNWEREQNKRRLPIIALTANATKEDVRRCLDAGMDAYCSKPINPLVVIRLIEEWHEKATAPK
jgi:signal transduction histidine kinase/CheY-like chemotaxis protein